MLLYLLQRFEQYNVSAGFLKSAPLLVSLGMYDPRLHVIVFVIAGVVGLCTDCSRTDVVKH